MRFLLSTALVLAAAGTVAFKEFSMKTIRGYVGESLTQLLKENPGRASRADLDRWTDNTPMVWPSNDLSGETFTFIYSDPAGEIRLPTAKLIWFNQYAGVVTSVTINTSEHKDTIDHIYTEISGIAQSFTKDGWKITFPMPSLEELKRAGSEGQNSMSIPATKFTKGNLEASIQFTSPGKVTSESRSFVANIEVVDPELEKSQAKKVYDTRQRVKGSMDDILPMSYWVK